MSTYNQREAADEEAEHIRDCNRSWILQMTERGKSLDDNREVCFDGLLLKGEKYEDCIGNPASTTPDNDGG